MKNFKEQTSLSRWISGHLPLKKGEVFERGFTLIELLVVIAIIGILAVLTVSTFITSQQRSRDVSRKTELKSLSDALNMYYVDNGEFPESSYINGLISDQGEFSDTSASDGSKIIYMKKVPNGGGSGVENMLYITSSTRKSFRIYTNLENTEDGDCVGLSDCVDLGYSISDGCCYILTSLNVGTTEVLF